jgi:hypothetical protein
MLASRSFGRQPRRRKNHNRRPRDIRHTFPAAHIVILSELEWMPADLKGEATGFIRKGAAGDQVDARTHNFSGRGN